jgi:hypothetical protein
MKDIMKLEKKLDKVEIKMNNNPHDINIIDEYTSLLEQFNNI